MSLAMFSWAIAWTNAKIVNEYLSFYNLIFLRFFIGFISIYPLIYKKNNIKMLTTQNLKFIIPCSIIFYIYNLSFFMGTHYGYAGKGAVLVTTLNPIITFIIMLFINKKIAGLKPQLNSASAFKNANIIIDFTIPKCTLEVLKIASKLKKRVVIGTTGFSKKEENLIKKYARKIPILKAGNMSLGINLLMYLTEIASKSLGDNFLSKVFEVHHKHKKDHPSGTALMLGKGIATGKKKGFYKLIGKKYLNKKSFPYSKKINFNSIRKGEIVGNHKVLFSSGKETITLDHEAFDRTLYSEGAFTAAKWLMGKKPGLYSVRDVLNFK